MQSVIDMPDGGRIIHDIMDDKDGVVLFVGRLNFRAGGAFCDRVAALFRECGLAFAQFEPPFEAASRRIDPVGRLHALPPVLYRPIKALHFMARPGASRFLFPAVRQRYQSVAFWEESLLRAVGALPRLPLLLAGYSQGARVATLAGARAGAAGIVCFGYPFKNPVGPEDAARTAHLGTLDTPCLIFQGTRDEYGGPDVSMRYRRSAAVALEFINADHGYALSPADGPAILHRLRDFVAQTVQFSAGSAACP
jgi:predicted alpha/beta-hydrolase family hydrolase